MTNYLTVVEVVTIHADQIKRYGGADGVRDMGALEAALFRPQSPDRASSRAMGKYDVVNTDRLRT